METSYLPSILSDTHGVYMFVYEYESMKTHWVVSSINKTRI